MSLLLDNVGNIWVGTGSGVCMYSPDATTVHNKRYESSPQPISLWQNFPNPVNSKTTIKYNLSKSGNVILKMYNHYGQELETLVDGFQTAGVYEITWQPKKGLRSGIYFYRLEVGEFSETKKISLQQ